MIKNLHVAFCCSVFLLALTANLNGQIQVTGGQDGQALLNSLVSQGLEISNIQLNCPDGAYGTFEGGQGIIGIDSGITLTSGSIDNIPGPNDESNATGSNGALGDPFLDELSTFPTNDACVLSFDLVPCGDIISFNYVFGSDEYNEFACSSFNDIFAFLISGPNPNGGDYTNENIALIPGSSLPVAINTVNNGIGAGGINCVSLDYAEYFNSNENGEFNTELDGFTVPFTALANVIPGETYSLYLAIADASDSSYDSAVMLQAGSLSGTFVTVSATTSVTTIGGIDELTEGCVDGIITFETNTPVNDDYVIEYTISGTAANGEDFEELEGYALIPLGASSATIELITIGDSDIEGDETITLTVGSQNLCEQSTQTVTFTLHDSPTITACCDNTILLGESANLSIDGSASDVTWLPNDGSLSSTTVPNPVATPTVTTTYTATTSFADCVATSSVTIFVIQPPVCAPSAGAVSVSPYVCAGGSAQASVSGTFLEPGDVQVFVLHNSPTSNVAMPGFINYGFSNTGIYASNGLPQNTTLYISSVVGPNNGSGLPDLSSPCTVISAATPVTFLSPVTVTVNEFCDWAVTGDMTITIAASGGLPSISGNYTLSGTNLNSIAVLPNTSTTIMLGQFDGLSYTYTATDGNGCSGSNSHTVICYKTPIELISFEGKAITQGNLLDWVTGSEYMNDFFTIERSMDGAIFENIHTVDGKLNSNSDIKYSYLDEQVGNGTYYYRLKQTDLNSNYTYSDVVVIKRAAHINGIQSITPVPTESTINVELNSPETIESVINISDLSGKIILSHKVSLVSGYNNLTIDVSSLISGLYFVNWNDGDSNYTQKIVKQ